MRLVNMRHRERDIERQRDRETERQRDRETERQRERDRETERQRDRDTSKLVERTTFLESLAHIVNDLGQHSVIAMTKKMAALCASMNAHNSKLSPFQRTGSHAIATQIAVCLNQCKAMTHCIRFIADHVNEKFTQSTDILRKVLADVDRHKLSSTSVQHVSESLQGLRLKATALREGSRKACFVFFYHMSEAVSWTQDNCNLVEKQTWMVCFDEMVPLVNLCLSMYDDGLYMQHPTQDNISLCQVLVDECNRLKHSSLTKWLLFLEMENSGKNI